MFKDTIVVDGKGHLFGRLASIIAKQLLAGQKVVLVRCEEMVISGSCAYLHACVCALLFNVLCVVRGWRYPHTHIYTRTVRLVIVCKCAVMRNKIRYAQFKNKVTRTNPKRGPFHHRSPARMFWRTVCVYFGGDTFESIACSHLIWCKDPRYASAQDRPWTAGAAETGGKSL
jgi:large subunit ribosomal protein L13Ae